MKIKEIFKKNNNMRVESIKQMGNVDNTNDTYSKAYRTDEIKKNLKEKNFNVSDLGAYTFKTTMFKNFLRTPHYEIQKSLENYEEMPSINAGINQIMLFITGNSVNITSKDDYTKKWFEKWQEQRPHLTDSIQTIILHNEVCGNAWIEPTWDTTKNKITYMNDFKVMPDPSRVYYNLKQAADLENEFWIFQVPYIFRSYGDMIIKQFLITYVKNGISWQETVYGIGLKPMDLIHIKTGWSRYDYYGRSYLASTINSSEIITQMLKNYAIASRFMAFGKKIFNIGDENDIVSPEEIKDITKQLNEPEDEEHVVINKKIGSTEITPTQFNEMPNGLMYNRKEINTGLLPVFMTSWADTLGSYSATSNAKIPFELNLENKRDKYIKLLNQNILTHIMKQNPKLKDATFEFGEVSLDDSKDIQTELLELYDNDIITLNQLLKGLNKETVDNGDIYKSKRNYIMQKEYTMNEQEYNQFNEPYIKNQHMKDIQSNDKEETREDLESDTKKIESILNERNQDVKDSDFDEKAQRMYNNLKRDYAIGYRQYIWKHNYIKDNPRLYHIKKNGKIYNIKTALDKKKEFPGWAANCYCTYKLVENTRVKKVKGEK